MWVVVSNQLFCVVAMLKLVDRSPSKNSSVCDQSKTTTAVLCMHARRCRPGGHHSEMMRVRAQLEKLKVARTRGDVNSAYISTPIPCVFLSAVLGSSVVLSDFPVDNTWRLTNSETSPLFTVIHFASPPLFPFASIPTNCDGTMHIHACV